MIASFQTPSTILLGAGARAHIAAWLRDHGLKRVLAVSDPFVVRQPYFAEMQESLSAAGIALAVFDGVQPDPTDENVLAGLERYRASGAEAILAIGGGSPIDTGKVIGAAAANPLPLPAMEGYQRIPQAGPPLIAVPTTAGTGSEATRAAVITDTQRAVKMLMMDAKLMPAVAVVDYELSLSMPAALTAHVGVDTLTHGIEAFVSRKAHAMADTMALSCIRLVAAWLRTAWREPGHRAAREGMSLAALQGGMAFSNASVALVHGMSRPLGAVFHLPHGLSNAVLLPAVTRFSLGGAPARYAEIARQLGCAAPSDSDAVAGEKLLAELAVLNQDLQVPRLRECLAGRQSEFEAALPKMAADALASGSPANNPVVPAVEQIIALYREAW